MKEKLIAGLLAALTTLTTVYPVLAAGTLGDFPGFLGLPGADFLIVVGSTADPSDVVGAADAAIALAVQSTEPLTTATSTVTGLERDGIDFCTSSTATTTAQCNLTSAITNGMAFPSLIKNTHYSGLKEGTFTWRSSNYDYEERVDATGVLMRHKLWASSINGTPKMVVADADIIYEYVFKKQLSGTGSPASPNYTYPIGVKLLGKDFTIVGVDTDSILMLVGSVCTGVTADKPCVYGDYSVYATLGGSSFVRVKILDKNGNISGEDTIAGWATGTSVLKTIGSLDITVTSIAALQDGTVVGVDMVVGPTGTTSHDYDATADVESTTATTNDAFPGTTRWGIQFVAGSSAAGTIASGAKLQVVYKPSTVEYYGAGGSISLPNSYGDLGFEGFNTNTFATITVKPYGPASVYNSTNKELQDTYLYGLEISSDKAGVIYGGSDYYSRAYLLFNASDAGNAYFPVVVGWYDTVSGKILVADAWRTAASGASAGNGAISTGTQYAYAKLNNTADTHLANFSYAFVLNNGEKSFYLNFTVYNTSRPLVAYAGDSATSTSIDIGFQNATSWSKSGARFDQAFLRLGATASSAETTEVNVTTEVATGTDRNAGKVTQDVVDDTGLTVLNTDANGASDIFKFKVPSKALAAKVYFGKLGASALVGDKKFVAVTVPVARLDTELTAGDKLKNLVVIGGSCKNREAALALGLTFPTCGAASTVPQDAALIKVVKDYPAVGKYTVVVAGWEAAQTRTASSVIQQYATLLAGQTASAVKVTAATAAGITAL